MPALRGLRRRLPAHRVVLATPQAYAPLARLTGAVDRVLDTTGLTHGPLSWPGPPPDVAVNLHGRGPQSHRLLAATRPRRLLAYASPPEHPDGPAFLDDVHEVLRWCRLVDGLDVGPVEGVEGGRNRDGHTAGGVSVETCDPDALDLDRPDEPPAVRDAVVVHPGAAFPSRRWPPERFAAVAADLAADGAQVVVTGSVGERALAERVAELARLPSSSVLAGTGTLTTLAALVAHARLVVCGDTGVAHLASAYRRPSVVLFGPVSPARWGPPPRPQHRALWRPPSEDWGGDPWGDELDPALGAIGVAEVLAVARELLDLPQTASASAAAPAAVPLLDVATAAGATAAGTAASGTAS